MTTNKKNNETLPTATLRVPRTRNNMAWSFGAAEVDRRQAEKNEKHHAFMDAMQAFRDAVAEFDFTASAYANA